MALSNNALKALASIGVQSTATEVATAVNGGGDLAAQSGASLVKAIVATAISQTTDFASLKVGDKVVMIPQVAGSADFIGPIAVAGDLGQAAVVGNLYLVIRDFTAPATAAAKF